MVANAAETIAIRADDFLNSIGANSAISKRGETLSDTITAGTSPFRHLTDVAAITLTLSNHPVIIEMSSQAPQRADMTRLIHLAGTTHDEMERLRLLRELEARVDLDATLRADLTKLLPVVDDWADGKSRVVVDQSRAAENGYLCRFFSGRVRAAGDGPVYPPDVSPGSPLRPIWAFYRGRMLI